jgi:futalosine hydrolase
MMTGIGKANSAGAAVLAIERGASIVICLGVAGSLREEVGLGDVVIATECVFSDEGVQTDEAFISCADLGFAIGPAGAIPVDEGLCGALGVRAAHRGPIATVSMCAGTEALAASRRGQGAVAEAMEGGAAGLAAWRLGARFAEVRVISNSTGERRSQRWDLDGALVRLSDVGAACRAGLGGVAAGL